MYAEHNSVKRPIITSLIYPMGLFLCLRFGRDAMSNYAQSHEWVYNEYHKTDNTITKRSYLDILKRRANNGSKVAQQYVDKIERAKCAT